MLRRAVTIAAVALATAALFVGLSLRQDIERDLRALAEDAGVDLFFLSLHNGRLSLQDLEQVRALPEVAAVAGQGTESTYYLPNQTYTYTWLNVTANYPEVYRLKLSAGRFFLDAADDGVLLGAEVAEVVFQGANPLGQSLECRPVIGVLAPISDDDVVREYLNRRVLTLRTPALLPNAPGTESSRGEFFSLLVRAAHDTVSAERAALSLYPDAQILSLYRFYSLASAGLDLALQRILVVSSVGLLLVSGVLVFTLVSLSTLQRLQEIGIRRSVGATSGDVWRLLLADAAILSLVAGVAGQAAGVAVLLAIGQPLVLSTLQLAPMGSAIIVCLAASFFPILRAAWMSPIDVLRQGGAPVGLSDRSAVALAAATSLCVALATCALVALSGTIQASSRYLSESWGDVGADLLIVRSPRESIVSAPDLAPADAGLIEAVPGVFSVVTLVRFMDASSRNAAMVGPGFADLGLVRITAGRPLSTDDLTSRRAVCLLSDELAEQLYGGTGLGEDYRVHGTTFQIVGQFGKTQAFLVDLILPLGFADLLPRTDARFYARVSPSADMDAVRREIVGAFRERYPDYARVDVLRADEVHARVIAFLRAANARLWLFGAIAALLAMGEVGALTRLLLRFRTTEIGIRRAVGARRAHVLQLAGTLSATFVLPGIVLGGGLGAAVLPPLLLHVLSVPVPASLPSQLAPPLIAAVGCTAIAAFSAAAYAKALPAALLRRRDT
jgi:putative ABC transport system permease protein